MATESGVRPNRRGVRSRERVLDAAEHVMAEDGFEAATLARIVEESGIPLSSVYHYFGSKEGVLLAVMERGAERFFADLPDPRERVGTPTEHLALAGALAVSALASHPSFLRLLIVFAVQPPQTGNGEVREVVGRVREMALKRLRRQIAIAFDADARTRRVDRAARLALATIDGAFVAAQTDTEITLDSLLEPFAPALVAAYEALR